MFYRELSAQQQEEALKQCNLMVTMRSAVSASPGLSAASKRDNPERPPTKATLPFLASLLQRKASATLFYRDVTAPDADPASTRQRPVESPAAATSSASGESLDGSDQAPLVVAAYGHAAGQRDDDDYDARSDGIDRKPAFSLPCQPQKNVEERDATRGHAAFDSLGNRIVSTTADTYATSPTASFGPTALLGPTASSVSETPPLAGTSLPPRRTSQLTYPCICEHLDAYGRAKRSPDHARILSPFEVRMTFWQRKSDLKKLKQRASGSDDSRDQADASTTPNSSTSRGASPTSIPDPDRFPLTRATSGSPGADTVLPPLPQLQQQPTPANAAPASARRSSATAWETPVRLLAASGNPMSEPPPADTAATVAAVAATASTVTPTTTDRARDTAGRSDDASESHNVSPLLPPPPAPTDATEPPAPPLPAAEPLAGSDKSPPLRTAAEQLTNGDGSLAEAHTPASASSSRPLPVEVSSQQGAVSGDVPVASAIGAPVNSIQAKPVRPAGSRSGTLDRGGGGRQHQPDDEHKYETLDHAAKPVSYSEDEGVCCSNIHSALAKRAKELVRPSYQKGDHPRDRPPVPAKPARPSVAARQHQPHQQDQHQKQSPTRPVSAGYEPIDTSRSIVPPIPGIPTTGPLKKKEAGSKCVTISGIMDSKEKKPDEFKSVQESKTSIQLKDARSRATADDAVHGAAPDVKIDVKVLSTRPQGYESIQAVQRGLVAEPTKHDEKKSLISRVKNIKVENPFKKTDENDQSDSEESKPRFMNKIFKKDKENKESGAIGASDGKEKISLSGKINKAFHREKKDSQNDSSDRNQSNEEKLTGRLGKMKFTKDGKETDATTHEIDARKILTTSKFAERQSKKPTKQSYFAGEQENTETSTENQSKEDFLTANDGQKEENDEPRAVDCSEKKLSLITRVFSRDAKEAELNNMQDSQQGKSLAEMISDFKVKVFARQEQNRESAGDGVGEGDEKKTFFERYFPPEKPTIQQIVLTEEMEPDCKRRRMGKITKFEQTKEVEGEVDSPARKLFKENIEKFASKVKEVQDIMPKNLMSRKDKDAATSGNALEKPSDESGIKHDYEVTTQVVVTRESSPAVQRCVSSSPPPNANLVVNNDDLGSLSASIDNVVRPPVDKATVFYAKVGSSEIEVKEDHYGRIQVSDKKEPIYAKPLKLLKRGFADLSKSTPTLPTHTDEPIEYIDAGELGLEQRQPIAGTGEPAKEEPTLGHHYEQLAEPEKQKRTVAEFKVRGRHGVTEVIKIETQLVKGKSLSALNEPATITTVKTFEKQKPPVPPRPQLSTPTIIGRKPGSSPTTPTSTVSIGPLAQPESFAVDDEASFGSPTAPAAPAAPTSRTSDTSGARSSVTKVAPPRPPPPTLPAASAASMCGSSTKSTPKHSLTSGLLASNSRLQAAILDTFSRFQRITPPTISVIKSVQRGPDVLEFTKTSTSAATATSTTSTATVRPAHDASSVYCQTDVALGADLLARIERALAAGTSPGAASELLHGGPLSPSAWTGSRVVADGDRVRSQGPTFYDEPVRLRAEFADDGSDFSKRISDLQSIRRSLVEAGGPPLQAAVALGIVLFWIYCPFFLLSYQSLCCLAILFLVFFK